ncbi:spermatogenesis-associated protein 20-like [Penaeus monodon]|uniref:spermatogenesis-associated protein 20-like n=1 Tax=Penaeus monodon TaxID=6687 RepID=UPI0018A7147F|nr:spermatogenesis-associated protein 20-like [Penaeus monodon]
MLTSWNGMMLGAMARAGVILGEKSYIERAIQAADFVKTYLFKDGLLLRSAYSVEDGQVSVGSSLEGFVDDYAWMIRGFLNLYEATLDTSWLELAEELQDKENELFWDSQEAGYFMTKAGDSSILLRIKEDQDGAEPSANSVSVGNLLRLSPLLDRADYREKAEAIFQLFAERLNKIPIALPEMTTALLIHKKHPVQIILAGKKGTDATQKMLQAVHGHLIPSHVILLADENHESLLYNRHSSLRHYHPKKPDETVAHVCQNFRCFNPRPRCRCYLASTGAKTGYWRGSYSGHYEIFSRNFDMFPKLFEAHSVHHVPLKQKTLFKLSIRGLTSQKPMWTWLAKCYQGDLRSPTPTPTPPAFDTDTEFVLIDKLKGEFPKIKVMDQQRS